MGPRPCREVKIFFFLRYDYQSINEDNLMDVASQPRTKVFVRALYIKQAKSLHLCPRLGINLKSLVDHFFNSICQECVRKVCADEIEAVSGFFA